jgi:hypothetical protein
MDLCQSLAQLKQEVDRHARLTVLAPHNRQPRDAFPDRAELAIPKAALAPPKCPLAPRDSTAASRFDSDLVVLESQSGL